MNQLLATGGVMAYLRMDSDPNPGTDIHPPPQKMGTVTIRDLDLDRNSSPKSVQWEQFLYSTM